MAGIIANGGSALFHNWADVSCYPGIGLSGDKASPVWQSGQTRDNHPNSVSMLGQRQIRMTSIEPAMGCDAGPTLNRYWVGRPTLCVRVQHSVGRNRPTR